ncbi:hypothetical protein [Paraburkholderia ultramafica]|uniref:hypothetical protein n=1 Tax=Paraburkholderia ultramafica TaxID=1544867 RepID=UPI001583F29A|nr:hypothetical protein [Paraburkholderia ultramafica]
MADTQAENLAGQGFARGDRQILHEKDDTPEADHVSGAVIARVHRRTWSVSPIPKSPPGDRTEDGSHEQLSSFLVR